MMDAVNVQQFNRLKAISMGEMGSEALERISSDFGHFTSEQAARMAMKLGINGVHLAHSYAYMPGNNIAEMQIAIDKFNGYEEAIREKLEGDINAA